MDKNRIWMIGSALLIVVVLALGFMLGVQPQLSVAADANAQRSTVESTNQQQEAALAKLKKDFESIATLKADLAALSVSVPDGTDVPAFVDQLNATANANGVVLSGITISDAQAYTPVAPQAIPAATAEGTTTSETPSTPAPQPTAVPGSPPVSNALITTDNFASLAVQVKVVGSYAQVLDFVSGLQAGKRLMLVDALSTQASTEHPELTEGTVSGLIYALVKADEVPSTATSTDSTATQAAG